MILKLDGREAEVEVYAEDGHAYLEAGHFTDGEGEPLSKEQLEELEAAHGCEIQDAWNTRNADSPFELANDR